MKYTLLQLVQKTLAFIDDFNVNSVDETEESEQVVQIVNIIYNDIATRYPWPHLRDIASLDTTATTNILRLPSTVLEIDWIKYDGKDVQYISPKAMQDVLDARDVSLSNVDNNGAIMDRNPKYWTSIDDEEIIFDSYNSSLDTALTSCMFLRTVSELNANGDYPNLPERFHSTLLYGCVAEACRVMKGDAGMAREYELKFKKGVDNMKRWARRVNLTESTMPNDYSRTYSKTVATSRSVIDAS